MITLKKRALILIVSYKIGFIPLSKFVYLIDNNIDRNIRKFEVE